MQKGGKKIATTATKALKISWEEGVFKKWVKIADVVKEFSKRGYNFPLGNVDKALQRAKYLTRKGRKGNYEYIQKYPYFKEK
ncbi:MAG: hypothetical protein KJI72_03845 [Patescibacteria group bacterium]|nr:hypothetical protein [Patescibacteria group bacterium]